MFFAMLACVLSACGSGVPVAFHNASERPLDSVVIPGQGFQASLGAMAPGESTYVTVYPSGESGLSVSFLADGKNHSSGPLNYFESGGHYKVSATVSSDLTVSVDSELHWW